MKILKPQTPKEKEIDNHTWISGKSLPTLSDNVFVKIKNDQVKRMEYFHDMMGHTSAFQLPETEDEEIWVGFYETDPSKTPFGKAQWMFPFAINPKFQEIIGWRYA